MTYVYILQSDWNKKMLYIGMSSNLRQRMKAHSSGATRTTRWYAPMKLVYYEAFMDAQDAVQREKSLKQFGASYRNLIKRIRNSRLGVLTHGGAG